MDMITVDVTDIGRVEPGAPVAVGRYGGYRSRLTQTIGYELMTSLPARNETLSARHEGVSPIPSSLSKPPLNEQIDNQAALLVRLIWRIRFT